MRFDLIELIELWREKIAIFAIYLTGGSVYKSRLSVRLCIKYKTMAVQPLNKTKIIKKKTNKIRRYQSDEFKRVKVRLEPANLLANS